MGSNQRRHVTIQYPLKHILAIAAITLLLTLAHAVGSSDSMGDQQLPAQSTTQPPPSTVLHPSSTSRSSSPSTSRSPPSSPSPSPSHSSSPSSHLPPLDSRLSSAIRNVIHDGLLASRTAHREFCDCDSSLYGAEMCAAMTRQCKASFCNPICLGMGWTIELEVDCQAAPGWKYCQQFKDEVEDAAKAITAQFQAHICMSTGFCNRTSTLVDWVENHTYGHKYPNHMLPIDSCLPHLHDLHPAIAASTCNACSKVVSAKIRRGTCQMGFTAGYELKEMSTFQERCEYVADYISSHAHSLLLDLQRSLCTCLGCCEASNGAGGRECYFPNTEKVWLKQLIDRVTSGVTKKIHQQNDKAAQHKKMFPMPPQPVKYTELKMEL